MDQGADGAAAEGSRDSGAWLFEGKAAGMAAALGHWRRVRRMKQSHAAELLGVSQATLSRWEAGSRTPDPEALERIARLIEAGLDSDADRALARLVSDGSRPTHLICDVTHRLLALSPARARECRTDPAGLLGRSLWRFATEAIARAESRLEALGWFEPAPPSVIAETPANGASAELAIAPSRYRWTRMRLSDGRHARLVETLPPVSSPS